MSDRERTDVRHAEGMVAVGSIPEGEEASYVPSLDEVGDAVRETAVRSFEDLQRRRFGRTDRT